MNEPEQSASTIFKNASTTYFVSSLFFPKNIKKDVFDLYAFVRVADDFVDNDPQDLKGLQEMYKNYIAILEADLEVNLAAGGAKVSHAKVISNFVVLQKKYNFKQAWVDAFFASMTLDTCKSKYLTMKETCSYMYGSAEVIGLFLASIFGLPEKSYSSARMLGRAMQYANMIRDIAEDIGLGRQYIPQEELAKYGLKSLSEIEARKNPEKFSSLIRGQIKYYLSWQEYADVGMEIIPKRLRAPVLAASDMYRFTLSRIAADPFVIFQKKVKPSKIRVAVSAIKHLLYD